MTLVLTLPCCHLECKQTCVSKSANVLVFVDDYLPQQQQYQQNLDIATDFINRLTRSIGRKHKFKLVRNNSVLTFPNIQNFMGALRSTSSSSGLSNDRNVFDIDLKSGSVNIAMIIGLPSKELFQQRSDRLATPTYIIGK
ncbi:uncharacterized protein LOC134281267 [Saccostrea cucullata]|uniref:uncharacterized protein LOC134281267 n=1 Tax=Saccostrea cuccullata TaxID=36930 RepID=UPI002ED00BB6